MKVYQYCLATILIFKDSHIFFFLEDLDMDSIINCKSGINIENHPVYCHINILDTTIPKLSIINQCCMPTNIKDKIPSSFSLQ